MGSRLKMITFCLNKANANGGKCGGPGALGKATGKKKYDALECPRDRHPGVSKFPPREHKSNNDRSLVRVEMRTQPGEARSPPATRFLRSL